MAITALYDTATYDGVAAYDAAFGVGSPKVELLLGGVWTDVTSYVRISDGISIVRGKQDWSQSPTFATCRLVFNNADGRFSPRNASGAYYGNIKRNTQLRVSAIDDHGVYQIRFWGEVSEWPVAWDLSGRDVQVAVVASGIRRRLLQQQPLGSPYSIAEKALSNVVLYLPMEDGDSATTFASGLPGGTAATFSGAVDPAADSSFVASGPLPTFGDGANFSIWVPPYTPGAAGVVIRGLMSITGGAATEYWTITVDTTGAHYFEFQFNATSDTVTINMVNYASGAVENTHTVGAWTQFGLGKQFRFQLYLNQNGTGIDYNVVLLAPGATSGSVYAQTVPSATLYTVTRIRATTTGTSSSQSVVMGHLTLENKSTGSWDIFDLAAVLDGYAGETAHARWTRITAAMGVTATVSDPSTSTELLGPQPMDTPINILDQAAFVDDGLSTELVSTFGLKFDARSSMYDKAVGLALNYSQCQEMQPVDDDQLVQNDVTVNRTNGGSSRAVATGALSPANIGTYATSYDLNLYTDSQTQYQAAWRMTEGSVDEPRLPVLTVDAVTAPAINSTQRDQILAFREGDTLAVAGNPTYSGLTSTEGFRVLGWTETFGINVWRFTFNCIPVTPYGDVFILNSATLGILDTNRLGL